MMEGPTKFVTNSLRQLWQQATKIVGYWLENGLKLWTGAGSAMPLS